MFSGEDSFDRAFYKEGLLSVSRTSVDYFVNEEECTITIKGGREYIHAVEVEGNLILSENYFSLLPGEVKTIAYRKAYDELPVDIVISAFGLI